MQPVHAHIHIINSRKQPIYVLSTFQLNECIASTFDTIKQQQQQPPYIPIFTEIKDNKRHELLALHSATKIKAIQAAINKKDAHTHTPILHVYHSWQRARCMQNN